MVEPVLMAPLRRRWAEVQEQAQKPRRAQGRLQRGAAHAAATTTSAGC